MSRDRCNSAQALAHADVVCTATTSAIPLFEDAQLKPGAHINAIGSYRPNVAEIPPATVCRARVVVDHRASALEEAGDLLMPLAQGLIQESHFSTELGEILLGRATARRSADEITLFKSVGVAIQDLSAGARALQNALPLNVGVHLPRGVLAPKTSGCRCNARAPGSAGNYDCQAARGAQHLTPRFVPGQP